LIDGIRSRERRSVDLSKLDVIVVAEALVKFWKVRAL